MTTTNTTQRTKGVIAAIALALPLLGAWLPASADTYDSPNHHVDRQKTILRIDQPGHNNEQRNGSDHGNRNNNNERHDYRNRNNDTERHDYRNRDKYTERHDYGDRGDHRERVLREMPHGYRVMHLHDRDYYMHEGHYYIHEPRGYVLVRPPIGTFVMGLPNGFFSLSIGGIPYFVAAGIYYQAEGNGYVVAAPPTPTPATIGPVSGNVVVNVPLLNVRSGPGYDFGVIGVVNQGSNLPAYGQAPGWHYIQMPSGSYGWVNDNFIVIAPPPPEG